MEDGGWRMEDGGWRMEDAWSGFIAGLIEGKPKGRKGEGRKGEGEGKENRNEVICTS